jgi:glycosyltransferase involved in cell wall biosynthesis
MLDQSKLPADRKSRRIIIGFNRYLMHGGEENSVIRIASHMEQAGHSVTRFWRASEEWLKPGAPPRWKQLFYLLNNPKVLQELKQTQEHTKAEVWMLHNVVPVISLGIYRLARELNVPIIQWLQNYRPVSPGAVLRAGNTQLEPDDPWLVAKEIMAGSWRGRFLTAWLAFGYWRLKNRGDFNSVKGWVPISSDMKHTFMRAGFPENKLHVLNHSWDVQPSLKTGPDSCYFIFLGRMVPEKGVRFLLDLWQQPEFKDIQLMMAGQGPIADAYKNRTPPNIRWVGFVKGEEKQRLLANARAMLFPCLWSEPLGLVTYEAYEQECPVLGSNLGGLKDTIVDGLTGRLLPPGDTTEWTRAIIHLAQNPQLAQKLGKQGRGWLETNATPEAWATKLDDILKKVLD